MTGNGSEWSKFHASPWMLLSLYLLICCDAIDISGHRGSGCSVPGCSGLYSENSIVSMLAAVQAGATHIECDLFLTADNQVVVFHGMTEHGDLGDTIIGGAGLVIEDENFAQLQTSGYTKLREPWARHVYDIQDGGDPREFAATFAKLEKDVQQKAVEEYRKLDLQDEYFGTMTTLEETLREVCFDETFRRNGVKFALEFKGFKKELVHRTLEIIEKGDFQSCVGMFSTFSWNPEKCTAETADDTFICPNGFDSERVDLMNELAKSNTSVPLALLFQPTEVPSASRIQEFMKPYGATWAHFSYMFRSAVGQNLKQMTMELHRMGLKVMVYFGGHAGDTFEDLVSCVEASVDMICTNDVQLAYKALNYVAPDKRRF